MNTSLLQGYLFEKSLASFPQRKRYKVTNQEVKLMMAVSLLAKDIPVPTKRVFQFVREMHHTANYWYVKATLNKLVGMRLLLSTPVGKKGFFRYRMSVMGTLLLHDLDYHAKEIANKYADYNSCKMKNANT